MSYPFSPAKIPALATIIEDLSFFDDWDDRYRYLIDLGKGLPALPQEAYSDAHKVRGCASQVWLTSHHNPDGRFHFLGDSDALIVKGLVALVIAMFTNKTASEIRAMDAHALFGTIGLKDHLTAQRSNGLASMVQRIQEIAARA